MMNDIKRIEMSVNSFCGMNRAMYIYAHSFRRGVMRDKGHDQKIVENMPDNVMRQMSPLERLKMQGGKAHKVRGMAARGADSMIAVYKDRFTYTFVMDKEVASIHFDAKSRKIFFSGHNIDNMELNDKQKLELANVIKVLEKDSEGKSLKEAYQATLGDRLADNK